MRKIALALTTALIMLVVFASCNDNETYADQKKRERSAINKFIADSAVNVISEANFFSQDSMTDVSKNEYVLFESSGVYMQIIRKGSGQKLKDGETANVLVRFSEYNMLTDSLQLTNDILYYSSIVDKMTVKNTSGTFTASFISGKSLMENVYGSTSVPSGWLVPLSYVNLCYPSEVTDEIAKVKLIVPSSQGQSYASQSVYPCLYTLTFQRGR